MASPPTAVDVLLRTAAVHTFDEDDRQRGTSIALRGSEIVAVGDDLDALATTGTLVIDDPELVVLPGFYDSHVHQFEENLELRSVPVDRSRSIDELVDTVAQAARDAAPGTWIVTSRNWHESALTNGSRPPTN